MVGTFDVPVLEHATDSAAMTNTNERLAISPNVFIMESFDKLRNFVVVCGTAMSRRWGGAYHKPVLEIQSTQGESAR